MRLKRVWEIIPTLGGGGAEKMVIDLASKISNQYDITIISLYDKSFAEKSRIDDLELLGCKVIYLNKRQGFDFRIVYKLICMIKKYNPSIIHTHLSAFQYVFIARLFHGSFMHIHTMHSVAGNENRIYEFLLKQAGIWKTTYFVALADTILIDMEKRYAISNNLITCIPNGVDTEAVAYKKRDTIKDNFHFVAVGSLVPVKNHVLVIKALAELKKKRYSKVRLTIVGEGILHEELVELTKKLGVESSVVFTGFVKNVIDYLYNADCFIMPSHYEGVSLALIEAASSGLPIIAARTGGTPELVGENAVLFDDDSISQLIEAMERIINDDEFRENMIRKAQIISSNHSLAKMVNAYDNLYEKVILDLER